MARRKINTLARTVAHIITNRNGQATGKEIYQAWWTLAETDPFTGCMKSMNQCGRSITDAIDLGLIEWVTGSGYAAIYREAA